MRLMLLALLVLSACGRPLTDNETAYLRALQGDQIDTDRIRIVGDNPARSYVYTIPVRPRTTCQERIWPPVTKARTVSVSPAASAVWNTLFIRPDLYAPDYMAGWPEQVTLYGAMLFSHEAVHVWQWQNRARTRYTPFKALREHGGSKDPYLFDDTTEQGFLDFGYEQQASIVEEYVCCRLLDPDAPRTARLRAMISREMPIAGLETALDAPRVILPWSGAKPDGICR